MQSGLTTTEVAVADRTAHLWLKARFMAPRLPGPIAENPCCPGSFLFLRLTSVGEI
jgi:hypothetical protein